MSASTKAERRLNAGPSFYDPADIPTAARSFGESALDKAVASYRAAAAKFSDADEAFEIAALVVENLGRRTRGCRATRRLAEAEAVQKQAMYNLERAGEALALTQARTKAGLSLKIALLMQIHDDDPDELVLAIRDPRQTLGARLSLSLALDFQRLIVEPPGEATGNCDVLLSQSQRSKLDGLLRSPIGADDVLVRNQTLSGPNSFETKS